MNIFITLLENVNKSRTSANNLSLKQTNFRFGLAWTRDEINTLKQRVVDTD
jgi:hypothetical protein